MAGRTTASSALMWAVSAALGIAPSPAAAADAVYTVSNYPVEARAKDAVTAKNTALADGQQAALRSLLRRLVPVTAYRRLKSMPPLKAADIVDGVAVKEERNSTTDYIATLDFSFQPAAVRAALQKNAIPFVDSQAPQTVLIPLYRDKPDGPFVSGKSVWFDAWNGLDLTHTLSPLKLDKLKPEIGPDTIKTLTSGAGGAGPALTAAYRSDNVVVAVAEPDATAKKLIVTLAGSDAVGPFTLKRAYRISGGDQAYTAELAAVVGLGVLEGRWKAAKAGAVGGIDVTGGAGIQIVAEFATLGEWNDMRAKILDADGAFDVAIGSVSPRSAEVSLRHAGGTEGLAGALAQRGLTLSNQAGTWLVRSTF